MQSRWGQGLFSGSSDKRRRHGHKLKHRSFLLTTRKVFHSACDGEQAQVDHRDCGVSLLGDFWKTSGCGPGQLALGLDGMTSRSPFQPQPLCGSVNHTSQPPSCTESFWSVCVCAGRVRVIKALAELVGKPVICQQMGQTLERCQ